MRRLASMTILAVASLCLTSGVLSAQTITSPPAVGPPVPQPVTWSFDSPAGTTLDMTQVASNVPGAVPKNVFGAPVVVSGVTTDSGTITFTPRLPPGSMVRIVFYYSSRAGSFT